MTRSPSLTATGFILELGKKKYKSGFERSAGLEQEPEGLNFSFML